MVQRSTSVSLFFVKFFPRLFFTNYHRKSFSIIAIQISSYRHHNIIYGFSSIINFYNQQKIKPGVDQKQGELNCKYKLNDETLDRLIIIKGLQKGNVSNKSFI